jgi:hypothetical protein
MFEGGRIFAHYPGRYGAVGANPLPTAPSPPVPSSAAI